MSTITIDTSSPERGWQPFLDWLVSEGLDPFDVRSITINPETKAAVVIKTKRRGGGKVYVEDGELATEIFNVRLSSLPPRRS